MSLLSQAVIAKDHALEQAADGAGGALMQWRWHWTLDESNPARVTVSQYARQVGRNQAVIWRYVKGFEFYASGSITPDEARTRAAMSAETQLATETVANEQGVSFVYAQKQYREEVRRVRDTARQAAEDRGTTTIDEIPSVAAFREKARVAEREQRGARRERHTLRYLEMESALTKARRYLLDAARASEQVDFDPEERELLQDTLDNVRRLLALLDRSIAGAYDTTDWKTELQVLAGGRAS